MDAIFQRPGRYNAPGTQAEKLLTLHEATKALGLHYWQLQRAVRRGSVPSYRPFNSRRMVKLSEVVAFIDSCREGGAE